MSDDPISVAADPTAIMDTHQWVVLENSDILVAEYDEDGVRRHPFDDALPFHERLTEVTLLPHDEENDHRYSVVIDPALHNTRPIFFRRRTFVDIPVTAATEGEDVPASMVSTAVPKLTCLGFQKTVCVGGQEVNVKAYLFLFPDGTVVLADRDIF